MTWWWLNPWHEAARQRNRAQALDLRLHATTRALIDAWSNWDREEREPSPGEQRRQLALDGDPRPADD
jgi:hypothetical protein